MKKIFFHFFCVVQIFALAILISCEGDKSMLEKEIDMSEKLKGEPIFNLSISDSVGKALSQLRENAIKRGVITDKEKVEMPAKLQFEGEVYEVNIRFKGDWLDHLITDKWSLRVKVEDGKTVRGMKTFSIQAPETRNFLREFIAHKMFQKADVITTRYDFVPVAINDKYVGVFAMEEHFDKYLIESNKRREAPIVKFNEENLWKVREERNGLSPDPQIPFFASANVSVFKKKRTFKNPVLKKQFFKARNGLLRLKINDEKIEEYLDLDQMARYFAIMDLIGGEHGHVWHNKRFYLNPVSNLLEPIGYDCNPKLFGSDQYFEAPFFLVKEERTRAIMDFFNFLMTKNQYFFRLYKKYLKEYSSKAYINQLRSELTNELDLWFEALGDEYSVEKTDKLDAFFIEENAQFIQKNLSKLDAFEPNYNYYHPKKFMWEDTLLMYKSVALKGMKVKNEEDSSFTVHYRNFHRSPIEIFGFALKSNTDSIIRLKNKLKVKQFDYSDYLSMIKLPWGVDRLYYTTKNNGDAVYSCNLSSWQFFQLFESPEKLGLQLPIEHQKKAKTIVVPKGNYTLSKDLFVPQGYSLIIEAGAKIDLINQASIISYSPTHFAGNVTDSILIYSSDSSGMGVNIINNTEESILEYTRFSNLTNMNKNNWVMTGAVTVYESNVSISNCVFESNHSEDGLNLVRCNFKIENSLVQNTRSDAFDADFCEGTISNSKFVNTGNDAVDFSGSDIKIKDCEFLNVDDKAISGGEDSDIEVWNAQVNKASVAFASKDQSELIIHSASVKHCELGAIAFKKKPEFGTSKLIMKDVDFDEVNNNFIAGKGCEVNWKDESVIGTMIIDVDSMYARFAPKF